MKAFKWVVIGAVVAVAIAVGAFIVVASPSQALRTARMIWMVS